MLSVIQKYVKPRSITILPTYRCNAECEHCCFDSNPRIKTRVERQLISSFIREASEFESIVQCVFSGGECFLLGDELFDHLKLAEGCGLKTRCVSNGYWGKSLPSAVGKARALRASGLDEINFSTGPRHQKFVGLEAVVNAARACLDEGIQTVVVLEMDRDSGTFRDEIINKFSDLGTEQASAFTLLESPWMGENVVHNTTSLVSAANVLSKVGCPEILSSLVLTPNGKVGLCCGLTREEIGSLNVDYQVGDLVGCVVQGTNNFLNIWLSVDGPEKMLAFASTVDASIEWEGKFAHRCDACRYLHSNEKVQTALAKGMPMAKEMVLSRFVLNQKRDLISGDQEVGQHG